MVSIPTSTSGMLSFLVMLAFLLSVFSLEDESSSLSGLDDAISEDIIKVQEIPQQTGNESWYDSISNTGTLIWFGASTIFDYLLLPFYLFADILVAISILPKEFYPVGIFIGMGLFSAIAVYIRGLI